MKVSVICVSDRPERLPLLVWSLIAQTHQDWELFVLDQSGAEGDEPGVRQYIPWLPGRVFDRVTFAKVRRVGDWGQTMKEQAAKRLATGDLLMFPADDAYYTPTALAEMVKVVEQGADLALCGWLYDLMGYHPMPPTPAVGHVDVGGFAVRRSVFLEHGWPSKEQTGDGELVVSLAAKHKVGLIHGVHYVKT